MKQYILGGSVLMVVLFLATPEQVAAACVYPNFEDDRGRCVSAAQTNYRSNYSYQPTIPSYQYTSPVYYNQNQQSQVAYLVQLQQLLARLQELQAQQQTYTYTYTYPNYYTNYNPGSNSRVDVITRRATDIDEDSAELNGEIDLNREDEAEVWFEWGERRNDLDNRTSRQDIDDRDDEEFSERIDDLDEDETYYFQAVARDEDVRRTYGSVRSFTTDDDRYRNDDEPEVETGRVRGITDDSAELYGNVDMNDFDDGTIFFVYGEDEDQVEDIADDYDEYRDIDEDGDDLQKVFVDDNIDHSSDAWADIFGLNDDTRYHYAFCVEFEDEDDDEMIICGDTERFTTDR